MAESSAVVSRKAEKDRIKEALEAEGYIISRAATALGYSEATLHRRLTQHGLQELVRERSQRVQRRRDNQEFPPAPHEVSRQAQDQRANREAGLCGCGRPPTPKLNGDPGKMCDLCRARSREQKAKPARTQQTDRRAFALEKERLLDELRKRRYG